MEKRILYFDCFSGISGDMTIGALIDLGIDQNEFIGRMEKLKLDEFSLEIKKGNKKGITGTDFTVHLKSSEHKHEIQTEHEHPHDYEHEHEHSHEHEPVHIHETEEHHHHKHEHARNLKDIHQIINQSDLSEFVKSTSKKIFRIVAEAESKIHGKPIDEVHFHEIGAVDSIVDIIGTAICIEMLHVDEIQSSALNLGSGFVHCEHGIFPVPAPATLEILNNVPVYSRNAQKELTTPTGAAIIKALSSEFGTLPEFTIEKIGYGLGKRDLETPNVLRAIIGKKKELQSFMMLETNIDNMNPEIYSYLFPKLLDNNALDVFVTPITMKKNRPANKLSVLCKEENVGQIEEIIFTETPTLGIRKYKVEREELERKSEKVKTSFGEISVKQAYRNGELIKLAPEYEECRQIAEKTGSPLINIYNEAISEAKRKFSANK
ncbi:MAG: nickel pincer cofactor biosynthesis protein LarC [Bacteroidota bacterium]|nr:nickel pincer cofactor biosynthesis protein LarC [Bacteroidota bacterium]